MDRTTQRPAIEIAIVWIAAACFGGAIGFALWALPLGLSLIASSAAGVIGASAGLLALGRVDRARGPHGERFVPVDFTDDDDVLTLDDQVLADDALLLDDPLPALGENARVVRLFAVPSMAGEPVPLPAPGEMAARIDVFLGGTRAAAAAIDPAVQSGPAAADASAALHAALADIRRSLRRACT